MKQNIIAYIKTKPTYPDPPFNPSSAYPEYSGPLSRKKNFVYDAFRNLLINLKLDAKNINKAEWNPFREFIKPGDKVVIKPNLVTHNNYGSGPLEAVITHGSIIRPILDYVLIALKGKGLIRIADSPQMEADFEKITSNNGLKKLTNYLKRQYKNVPEIQLIDLRKERVYFGFFSIWKREKLPGDPLGYSLIDLSENSEMGDLDSNLLYGADFNRQITHKAHSDGHHQYLIANSILDSDVFISIPKLKTHKKTGVTLNIKNSVGISGDKNYIPHYKIGSPEAGGDEHSKYYLGDRINRLLVDFLLGKNEKWGKFLYAFWAAFHHGAKWLFGIKTAEEGNWPGNDVAWRMALDLAKIILYCDKNGNLQKTPQRKYFSIIDGIIAGDHNGPLSPDAFKAGLLIAGFSPLATDILATHLIGFDYRKIKTFKNGLALKEFKLSNPLNKYNLITDTGLKQNLISFLENQKPIYHFRPHDNWVGAIELKK